MLVSSVASLIVWFPLLSTNIAKALSTFTKYKIASCRPLYRVFTGRTKTCIDLNPTYIDIIFFNNIIPLLYHITCSWFMKFDFTQKTKFASA